MDSRINNILHSNLVRLFFLLVAFSLCSRRRRRRRRRMITNKWWASSVYNWTAQLYGQDNSYPLRQNIEHRIYWNINIVISRQVHVYMVYKYICVRVCVFTVIVIFCVAHILQFGSHAASSVFRTFKDRSYTIQISFLHNNNNHKRSRNREIRLIYK